MTVPSDGVETMRPRNMSDKSPNSQGRKAPRREVNIKELDGTRVPIGSEMVGSRTPEATKE